MLEPRPHNLLVGPSALALNPHFLLLLSPVLVVWNTSMIYFYARARDVVLAHARDLGWNPILWQIAKMLNAEKANKRGVGLKTS